MAGTNWATFAARKNLGTTAENALRDLLIGRGAVVELHQQNRDATHQRDSAAVAHLASGAVHLPDLSVTWPMHPIRRFGVEVKAKSPLGRDGGWGWDIYAYQRAMRWSEISGAPVFYAIRDLSLAPLPAAGEMDDALCWHVASTWKLSHSPERASDGRYHYWPATVFTPLVVLLHGGADIAAAVVPCLPTGDGQPPIIL